MNYRHIFHAGNPADVMKHAVLALILDHLRAKPTPFCVLDTHAGIGRYDLASEAARKTGESDEGIGRLFGHPLPHPALAPYLDAVQALNPDGVLRWYPGSPPIYTTLTIGSRLPLTQSATGKVFLAFQNETFVSDVLQRELVRDRTDGPIDIDAIRRQVRRELIAGVDGTTIPGLRAFAGPVFNLQGQLVLVVSVIASQTFKIDEDAAVREQLLNACREITHRLGGRWPETA